MQRVQRLCERATRWHDKQINNICRISFELCNEKFTGFCRVFGIKGVRARSGDDVCLQGD